MSARWREPNMATRGPWSVIGADARKLEIVTENEALAPIATVHMDPVLGVQRANARLIAAAPDLLAALKEQRLGATGCFCGGIGGHDESCLRGQAAIAKAEGRS
jgi:hypothetical protein